MDNDDDAAELNRWLAELTDTDAGHRVLAAAYLGRHPNSHNIPPLLQALTDDGCVALEAAVALSRHGTETRAALRERLGDDHIQVRSMATFALAILGDTACLPSLVHLAADRARDIQGGIDPDLPNPARAMLLDWAERTGEVTVPKGTLEHGASHVRAFAA